MQNHNVFHEVPVELSAERVDELLTTPGLRIERIVSTGQASPPGFWYDQDESEWVLLLSGAARLQVAGETSERTLKPGDFVHLPAHVKHRVTWTAVDQPTIWLAIFYV